MVYIKRDNQGRICAISHTQLVDYEEHKDIDNPEIVEFLIHCDKDLHTQFLESDLKFIRVLEDLINILLEKHVITITDFPQPVIEKLLARQTFRHRLSGVAGMEYRDDET